MRYMDIVEEAYGLLPGHPDVQRGRTTVCVHVERHVVRFTNSAGEGYKILSVSVDTETLTPDYPLWRPLPE